jgi:hypothetical protein
MTDFARRHAKKIVEKIDQISRTRALTDDETSVLEHFIEVADGRKPASSRIPFRGNKILAQMGIKRDMAAYRLQQRPNKRVTSRERLRTKLT